MTKLAVVAALTLCGTVLSLSAASAAGSYTLVEGCSYPNGWNYTDFIRDLNGTPRGLDHQCIDTYRDGHLIGRRRAVLN